MRDEVRRRLHAIDERLADVPLPASLEQRVMTSIAERPSGSPRVLVGAAVLVAIVLAFALGLRMRPDPVPPPVSDAAAPTTVAAAPIEMPAPAPPSTTPRLAWAGALAFDRACTFSGDDELHVNGGCRMVLDEPGLTMETWAPTRIARTDHGVRMLDGQVAFAVEHVPEGAPRVRIDVAAGAIEVIGTRFAIVQDGESGHVDLLEGAIAFADREGSEHAVVPGRRLRWSGGRVVAPAMPDGESGPRKGVAVAVDLDTTLDQVAALRRAGRYRDAVDVLHRARRSLGDGDGAEILSFEEGTLREHDSADPAMCAFWRGHLARFPQGDYAAAVRGRMDRAGCDDP